MQFLKTTQSTLAMEKNPYQNWVSEANESIEKREKMAEIRTNKMRINPSLDTIKFTVPPMR